jgi:DNA-binding transcriptional LysR family regulator
VLRAGDLQDSSLVGRRIATFEQVTCASADYVSQFGTPATPDDLTGHKMVAYMASTTGRPYPLEFMMGGQLAERTVSFDVTVRGAEIYTAAGLADFGMIQVPRYRIEHEIAAGRLHVLLADFPPPVMNFSILYPQNRQLSARVRVFSDWLTEMFSAVDQA